MPRNPSNEQAEAAWRFMRFLSENSVIWATGGQVPARNDLLQTPEFQRLPVPSAFARQLPYVQYEPLIPRGAALMPFVDPVVEAVLLDYGDPATLLKKAARQVQQVLDKP